MAPRSIGAAHIIDRRASLVHKATPASSTAQPHGRHPPEASGVYGPERGLRGGTLAPLKKLPTVERHAHGSCDNRTILECGRQHLDQCLCPTTTDSKQPHMSLAMRYLAKALFVCQKTALSASLMSAYLEGLDTFAQHPMIGTTSCAGRRRGQPPLPDTTGDIANGLSSFS